MTKYDTLFNETAPANSVFVTKGALDPFAAPDELVGREAQERTLATILNGVHEGYLPTTMTVYGPPGTGKTLTTRRLCQAFADRVGVFTFEYVNLKECRTLFSAANEILVALTGERKRAYEGLDGVFDGIWTALEAYPEFVVLILDEIDHVYQDTNYDPNDFFYRLIRGEGKQRRNLNLSLVLVSNELVDVDLRLDSRVQSAMSGEEVFFPPYDTDALGRILAPRLDRAFRDGALSAAVQQYGVRQAATRWGDVRKAVRLFRQAGEAATAADSDRLTRAHIDDTLNATAREALVEKVLALPAQHFLVLRVIVGWSDETGSIIQPVTSVELTETYEALVAEESQIGERARRDVITDLETMGLIETWLESSGRDGRHKRIETTFEPTWVCEIAEEYLDQSPDLGAN